MRKKSAKHCTFETNAYVYRMYCDVRYNLHLWFSNAFVRRDTKPTKERRSFFFLMQVFLTWGIRTSCEYRKQMVKVWDLIFERNFCLKSFLSQTFFQLFCSAKIKPIFFYILLNYCSLLIFLLPLFLLLLIILLLLSPCNCQMVFLAADVAWKRAMAGNFSFLQWN